MAFSIVGQFLDGRFVWARRALGSQKRRFPARAVLTVAVPLLVLYKVC
jgi:hypothetical protein